MLKYRLLVAIPLILIVVALLYCGSFSLLFWINSIVFLYAAWEWSALAGLSSSLARFWYVVAFLVCAEWISVYSQLTLPLGFFIAILCWWITWTWVFRYSKGAGRWACGISARALVGIIGLWGAWQSLLTIWLIFGPTVLLFFFVLVWGADSGAYAAGRLFGKTLLIPSVSPKKTWEGIVGGVLAVFIIDAAFFYFLPPLLQQPLALIVLSLLVFIFSVMGDLVESLLKRVAGVKDSGRLLPGHGGLLDRIDSMICAAPAAVVALLIF